MVRDAVDLRIVKGHSISPAEPRREEGGGAGSIVVRSFCLASVAVALLAGCSGDVPTLPPNAGATYEELTGADAPEFLDRITTFAWDDGGEAAAKTLNWISADATSPDIEVARRSGEAAHSIATYLSDNESTLIDGLPSGLFGRDHESLGDRNPHLVRAYAAALTPFQGSMIGDTSGRHGFSPLLRGAGDYAPIRDVLSVIATDREAVGHFVEAAYRTVDAYTKSFAEAAAQQPPLPTDDLEYGARLAGVVYGGADSSNGDITARNSEQALTYAAYTIASAFRPELGIISHEYFANGALLPPNRISDDQLKTYTSELRQFLNHNVTVGSALNNFTAQFNAAANSA